MYILFRIFDISMLVKKQKKVLNFSIMFNFFIKNRYIVVVKRKILTTFEE